MPVISRIEIPNFAALGKDIESFLSNMPVVSGVMAINFFKDRFEQGGWIDKGGLERWEKRQDAAAKGSILNVSGFLKNAFDQETGKDFVRVFNYAPYASLHNEGGVIHHPGGTPYIVMAGQAFFINKNTAKELKAKGRTVKTTKPHLISVPRRQFMGESEFFMKRIETNWEAEKKRLETKYL